MGRFRWHRVAAVKRGTTIRRIRPLKYEQEFTDTPQYPPILDISYEARKGRETVEWHEKIKSLKTVEEKMFEINMPRYYGWKPIMLWEESIPYNAMSFAQHVTRTHFREFKDLPHYSIDLEEESHKLVGQIKPWIEEALIFEYKYRRYVFVVPSRVLLEWRRLWFPPMLGFPSDPFLSTALRQWCYKRIAVLLKSTYSFQAHTKYSKILTLPVMTANGLC